MVWGRLRPLGLAGGLLLACHVGVAMADQSQMVVATIYQPGSAAGITRSVSLGALAQNCAGYGGPSNSVLFPPGVAYPVPQSSWSLRTVLECGLSQSVAAITAVDVQKSSGAWEDPLTSGDLSAAGDFAVSGELPVVSDDGTGIVYFRPQRTATDDNAADQVTHPASLVLDVYEGPLLTVAVHPGSESVAAGAAVNFTAAVTDAHGNQVDPATLAFTWSLDGAPSAQTTTFSQTFASAGRYTITATANDDQGGGGADTVQITVGSSQDTTPGPSNTTTPGTTTQPGAPAIGQQKGAGKTPSGTTTPAKHRQATPAARKTPRRHAATPAPKPAVRAPTQAAPPAAVAPVKRQPTSHLGTTMIAGRLIGNVTLLPADASPLVTVVVPVSAPAVRRPTRASRLAAITGTLAVVLLLGLGAASQLRPRRLVAG